jgi:hypothetical protein
MTSITDDRLANGSRVIDIGGLAPDCEEEGGEGKNLVVFALDPGWGTGWSALKVPVAYLLRHGTARTLPRCRWRHGQILRSGIAPGQQSPLATAQSDSRHVDSIFDVAYGIHSEFVYDADEEIDDEGHTGSDLGWESDAFVFVVESFTLRMMSMDDSLLAPRRVLDRFLDRLWVNRSSVPVVHQSPSEAIRTVTDERLRRWGMYDRASGRHARDADRHAILFIRKFADDPKLREQLGFRDA